MSVFSELLTDEQFEAAKPIARAAIPLLEGTSKQDKFLLVLSILDYLGSGPRPDYPMAFAISYQDCDNLLSDNLTTLLNTIASYSPKVQLALAAAIVTQLVYEF